MTLPLPAAIIDCFGVGVVVVCVVARNRVLLFLLFLGGLLSGCGVVLPNLSPVAGSKPDPKNPYSVSINEVVKRVKCEIWLSIKDRPEKAYPWFNKWVVQSDLTLTVNDSSGLNPGATFIQPLKVASTTASLGIGAGITNTVFRTEIVSFSISVADLRREFEKPTADMIANYNGCYPYGITDLTGNLGLVEWVNSAFGPVDNGLLREGIHGAPKAPPGTQGGAPAPLTGLTEDQIKAFNTEATKSPPLPTVPSEFPPNLKKSIETIYHEYNVLIDALKFIGTANDLIKQNHADDEYFANLATDLNTEIKWVKDLGGSPKIVTKLTAYQKKIQDDIAPPPGSDPDRLKVIIADSQAIVPPLASQIAQDLGPVIPMVQVQCDCYLDGTDKTDGENVLKCLKAIQGVVKLLNPASPTKNPPIDAISHQVNFVIALNANANPLWTLVHFKGPSPGSGNFASLSESNTHNLTIVMGAPGAAAAANARSALTLSNALATQLAPQLGMTPSIVP